MDLINKILDRFVIEGNVTGFQRYGNGHINDTLSVTTTVCRYILQAINGNVFKKPEQVMDNITRVTEFLRRDADDPRAVLRLVPTKDGATYIMQDGICWRMYYFINDALCLETVESEDDFYECAFAFGNFQRRLSAFPAEKLHETIPDFHNTPKRYRDFLTAVENDAAGRAAAVQREIDFYKDRADFCSVLNDANRAGSLPLRVTHNDTKSNNVMLDAATHKALCVIDLDTIMPGYSVNDFGDAIRFGASTAAEDEPDLEKVHFSLPLFEAYTHGFLAGCGGQLTESEVLLLPEGAKMMTLECGMRFLGDYLNGDTYFKTDYPEHNLVRCRTQQKLVLEMEENFAEMKRIAAKCGGIH